MSHESFISQQAQGSYIAQAAHGGNANVNVFLPPPPIQEQNRTRFLEQLRNHYRDWWNQSLRGMALMILGLTEKPDAVLHHPELLFVSDQQLERSLPPGTSILQVYDACGQELLILGEPGAGKSMLLLDLAKHLVERAEHSATYPLPVILPLSSWAQKQQSLQEWFPAQLSLIYNVPLQVGRAWVLTNQLLPLLDGLDEVPQGARVACMNAIKVYRKEHLIPLVVCSRRKEYEEIEHKHHLILQNAVVVEPLSSQQVKAYLIQVGPSLAAVRTALQTNPVLQELITTPLMLNVLILAYRGVHVHDLPKQGSADAQQRQIFVSYVRRMVEHKGGRKSSLENTRTSLNWLARQMQKHSQTVFYLEHLQPNWLTAQQQATYVWLAVRLPGVLIGILTSFIIKLTIFSDLSSTTIPELITYGVLSGLMGGLFSEASLPLHRKVSSQPRYGHTIIMSLAVSVIIGLTIGLNCGLALAQWYSFSDCLHIGSIYGVGIGLGSLLLQILSRKILLLTLTAHESGKWQWRYAIFLVQIAHQKRTFFVMSVVGLSFGLSNIVSGSYKPIYGLLAGLESGLVFGLISLLIGLVLKGQGEDIHLTERLSWTWRGLKRSLLSPEHRRMTLLLTSVVTLIYLLNLVLQYRAYPALSDKLIDWTGDALGIGIGAGLLYWIFVGLFQSVSKGRTEDHLRHVPNQGIQHSIRNSILMGIIPGGAISALTLLISSHISDPTSHFTLFPFLLAACSGLLVISVAGGLSTLRHYIIRLLLWHSDAFPWNASCFLDNATSRILLRKVGGGYSFVHRLILEFFASWDTISVEDEQF